MLDELEFASPPNGLNADDFFALWGVRFEFDRPFAGVGDAFSNHKQGIVSFLSDTAFADELNSNPCVTGAFCREQDVSLLRQGIVPLVVDDPKFYFFSLVDHLARTFQQPFPTEIGEGCAIDPTATVSPTTVILGRNVVVEAGARVMPGTIIGDNVIIRANATVGVDGFQHQKTSRGIISPLHDGWLFIGEGAEIGYSANISRGFSYRPTRIGPDVKTDAFAYIAHGASIGSRTIICAHAAVMGHVEVGDDSWIGPSSVVSSRLKVGAGAKVSLGAVVTKDVPAGIRVSGNFAIPHGRFIEQLKDRAAIDAMGLKLLSPLGDEC